MDWDETGCPGSKLIFNYILNNDELMDKIKSR
jgi:hypothetical protein